MELAYLNTWRLLQVPICLQFGMFWQKGRSRQLDCNRRDRNKWRLLQFHFWKRWRRRWRVQPMGHKGALQRNAKEWVKWKMAKQLTDTLGFRVEKFPTRVRCKSAVGMRLVGSTQDKSRETFVGDIVPDEIIRVGGIVEHFGICDCRRIRTGNS